VKYFAQNAQIISTMSGGTQSLISKIEDVARLLCQKNCFDKALGVLIAVSPSDASFFKNIKEWKVMTSESLEKSDLVLVFIGAEPCLPCATINIGAMRHSNAEASTGVVR